MVVYGGQQYYPQEYEAMDVEVPLRFRKSYKRPKQREPFRLLKRFRQETGIGHVHAETENVRIYEWDRMQNPTSPIDLSTTGRNWQSHFLPADKSNSINDSGCKSVSSSNNSESNENNTEYERMLFETHGCTMYHHQRAQLLDSDHIETEF